MEEPMQIFESIPAFQQKFKNFLQQRKKVAALDHYQTAAPFKHRDYLTLIKRCMKREFLDEREAGFLDHLLDKYEIRYLDWAHKTRWLKQQMAQMAQKPSKTPQILFDFAKRLEVPINIPFEVMGIKNGYQPVRRVR
jgi:hypothetical protein